MKHLEVFPPILRVLAGIRELGKRTSPMLRLETKQVRCDCLSQYWHLLHNQKSLCNLMRQGENEAWWYCGNGVTICLTPGNKLEGCAENTESLGMRAGEREEMQVWQKWIFPFSLSHVN